MTEKEIFKGCRKGKIKCQEFLYRQYYSYGMSICLRFAVSREDATEILNDSFLKVFDNISKFDQSRSFKSWFRRIIINTVFDHYRANVKYHNNIVLDEPEIEEIKNQEIEKSLNVEEILDLFKKLPLNFRMIFNLYEIEGYNHEEIAAMLDIAPGTSRSHLSRAKKLLRCYYFDKENKKYNEAI